MRVVVWVIIRECVCVCVCVCVHVISHGSYDGVSWGLGEGVRGLDKVTWEVMIS